MRKLEDEIDAAVRICAHADEGGPAHLLRAGEVCDRGQWHCPKCGASASEIRRAGHRRRDEGTGEWWPRMMSVPPSTACPEACTCLPEHRSLAEHNAEVPGRRSGGKRRGPGPMRMRAGERRTDDLSGCVLSTRPRVAVSKRQGRSGGRREDGLEPVRGRGGRVGKLVRESLEPDEFVTGGGIDAGISTEKW